MSTAESYLLSGSIPGSTLLCTLCQKQQNISISSDIRIYFCIFALSNPNGFADNERLASMAQRVFHHQLTLAFKCGLIILSLLVLYFFWIKKAIIGLFVVIIVVGMIERVLHTTYEFVHTKPIDRDEEMEFLVINRGRFSSNKNIALRDIVKCTPMRVNFGLSHYLLLEYGAGNLLAVQPDDEPAFIEELTKRQKAEDGSFAW